MVRRGSKKRTIRSSKNGPFDKKFGKVKRLILADPVDAADAQPEVLESYAKAQELLNILFSGGLGITPSVKIQKLFDVIDARFKELMLARAMSSRPRRRVRDVNQTSLFD